MNKGFSLLEVIIAIAIFGTGIAGAIALTTQTISTGTFVQKQLTAAYLAQEGLEVIHNLRHTNWAKEAEGILTNNAETKWFSGLDRPGCTPEPFDNSACPAENSPIYAIVNYNSTTIIQTGVDDPLWQMSFDSVASRYIHSANAPVYNRHIEISYAQDVDGKEYMHVKSIVTWDKGSISAEDLLYNWKEAPQ